mmetsp:Transcript_21371/g.53882  ORF Transcript_21371/g.53882 Transcript_21371/m.53882 type:complete len:727 (-) Transcript_21371:16-2196(-)
MSGDESVVSPSALDRAEKSNKKKHEKHHKRDKKEKTPRGSAPDVTVDTNNGSSSVSASKSATSHKRANGSSGEKKKKRASTSTLGEPESASATASTPSSSSLSAVNTSSTSSSASNLRPRFVPFGQEEAHAALMAKRTAERLTRRTIARERMARYRALKAKEEAERKRMHDALMAAAFKGEGDDVPQGVGPLSESASQEARSAAFEKLLESEREYVQNLRLLLTKYLLPGSSSSSEALPTSPSAFASLVSRLEQILRVNEDVLSQLEALNKKQPNDQMIGLICLQLAAYLKIYIQYCSDEMHALDTVRQAFSQFPSESPLHSLVEGLDGRNLRSLLKLPVERACQYPDYILQILECTPVDHPDRLQMQAGYVVVKRASTDIDTKRRRAENQQKIITLQQSLVQPKKMGIPGFSDKSGALRLLTPSRRLIGAALFPNVVIKKKSFKSAWIYFFNDLLLFTRDREDEKQEVLFHVDLANVQLSVFEADGETVLRFHVVNQGAKANQSVTIQVHCHNKTQMDRWSEVVTSCMLDATNADTKTRLPGVSSALKPSVTGRTVVVGEHSSTSKLLAHEAPTPRSSVAASGGAAALRPTKSHDALHTLAIRSSSAEDVTREDCSLSGRAITPKGDASPSKRSINLSAKKKKHSSSSLTLSESAPVTTAAGEKKKKSTSSSKNHHHHHHKSKESVETSGKKSHRREPSDSKKESEEQQQPEEEPKDEEPSAARQ